MTIMTNSLQKIIQISTRESVKSKVMCIVIIVAHQQFTSIPRWHYQFLYIYMRNHYYLDNKCTP